MIILNLNFRYLASGESFSSLHKQFRMGKSTASTTIYRTLEILWRKLQPQVMRLPEREEWQKIVDELEERWQVPHCWGAMDGKHVIMQVLT